MTRERAEPQLSIPGSLSDNPAVTSLPPTAGHVAGTQRGLGTSVGTWFGLQIHRGHLQSRIRAAPGWGWNETGESPPGPGKASFS